MVVVFFGTPQFAVPTLQLLLDSRHRVSGVVTQPDRPRGRGQKMTEAPVKALAIQHGLPVIQPEKLTDPAVADTLRAWHADIGVVVAYGRIIPDQLLEIPQFGMINVHASLLPKYRGAAPIHRAVIDGETLTGVTIMRVATRLDSGDMFAKATRPIALDETSDVVERDLSNIGARLLLDVLDSIDSGTAREEEQDHTRATFAPKITRDDGAIDWSLPASAIHNRVRGLYPWPHAFTYLDGSRLILLRTRVDSESDSISPAAAGPHEPGTVIDASRDAIRVATGHGGRLLIEEIQPEGKRPMRVRDYLAGRPLQAGARFVGRGWSATPGGPDKARPTES
jgi:methionyl-tRNA formyltransferase